MKATTNLVGGVYRKVYAGFLTGRRINALTLEAEAWFWRVHAIADDFGNLHGEPSVLKAIAAPCRPLPLAKVAKLTNELVNAGLVSRYEIDGEAYLHIHGFEARQAPRNGKRIQRFPLNPDFQMRPDSSRCIQKVPDESDSTTRHDTDDYTDDVNYTDTDDVSDVDAETDPVRRNLDIKPGSLSGPRGPSAQRPPASSAADSAGPGRKTAESAYRNRFALEVSEALGLGPQGTLAQRRSLMAVARELLARPDPESALIEAVRIARDKKAAGLDKPAAAWQKTMNERFGLK